MSKEELYRSLFVILFALRGLMFAAWSRSRQKKESLDLGCRFHVQHINDIREIKHRVYGNRERQKYHVIMSFRHFSRLPFAVFNVKRPVFAFVNNASNYFKFLSRSATITNLCLNSVKISGCQRFSYERGNQIMQLRQNIPRKPHSTCNSFLCEA